MPRAIVVDFEDGRTIECPFDDLVLIASIWGTARGMDDERILDCLSLIPTLVRHAGIEVTR